MRGSAFLRRAVRDHLETNLNTYVQLVATAQGVDVPPVAEWHHDMRSKRRVERWPVLMMTAQYGINRGRIDLVDGQPVHQWDWVLRAWLWARGEDTIQTADRAEVLAVATVETLTALPALADQVDRARVLTEGDGQAMRVSLSDVEPLPGSRLSIAGAYVEFVATMAETARRTPLGTATDLGLDVEPKEP